MDTGKEAIEALAIGVAIMLLAATLFCTVGNVKYGRMILDGIYGRMEAEQYQAEDANFSFCMNQFVKVPAVAAYAFIGYNFDKIESVKCEICHKKFTVLDELDWGYLVYKTDNFEDVCIRNHLKGHVWIKAEKGKNATLYKLTIKEGPH